MRRLCALQGGSPLVPNPIWQNLKTYEEVMGQRRVESETCKSLSFTAYGTAFLMEIVPPFRAIADFGKCRVAETSRLHQNNVEICILRFLTRFFMHFRAIGVFRSQSLQNS